MWPLVVPAAVFFLQFVAIGAGKPGEYGRFVIFFSTAFAIGAACLLVRTKTKLGPTLNWTAGAVVVLWVALGAMEHLRNFALDMSPRGTRIRAAEAVAKFIESAQGDGVRVFGKVQLLLYLTPFKYINLEAHSPDYGFDAWRLMYFFGTFGLLIMLSYVLYRRKDILV